MVRTRSAFLILREAFYGTTRFDDFAERVGISEPVAAARLRELVEQGLLEREDYREPGQRTRQHYRLTEKGADLFPALAALMQWGDRWLDDGRPGRAAPPRTAASPSRVQLRCAAGHEVSARPTSTSRCANPPAPRRSARSAASASASASNQECADERADSGSKSKTCFGSPLPGAFSMKAPVTGSEKSRAASSPAPHPVLGCGRETRCDLRRGVRPRPTS